MKSSLRVRFSLLMVLLVLLAAGCGVKKDSPAPGCVEYWGLAASGGCFGKTAILDLRVQPALDCLTVRVNNCNGGVLDVDNQCADPLSIGGVEIAAGERSVSLDLLGAPDGEVQLVRVYSNFSDHVPQQDMPVSLQGTLGGQTLALSFTKTAPLCD